MEERNKTKRTKYTILEHDPDFQSSETRMRVLNAVNLWNSPDLAMASLIFSTCHELLCDKVARGLN
ncbi:MAG: hypothetical protein J4473_05795 [Candidatus Aenigmarchaeota archaeon]|nr:hypothetical protein [Candidatus Aenigmarchaeota archaeon]